VKTRIALAKEAFNMRKESFDKRRIKQNTEKENGKGVGVARSAVWMRDMGFAKGAKRQIGGTRNVVVEKFRKA
jgi:hypothetical protein